MQRASHFETAHGPWLPHVLRWLVTCCLLMSSAPTRAQGPLLTPGAESDAPPEAVEHYNRGRELYQAGRYREAAVELEQASQLDPGSANLVFNLARVYELLGELDRAIVEYRRYRGMIPPTDLEEQERIDGTLQRLEGARDEQARKPPQRPAAPVIVTTPARRRGVADAAFWILASSAGAALVTGGVTGILALQQEHDTQRFTLGRDGDNAARERLETRADRLALSSDISMLAGATLGITAILLFALREKPVDGGATSKVELGALPGGALLTFGGRL